MKKKIVWICRHLSFIISNKIQLQQMQMLANVGNRSIFRTKFLKPIVGTTYVDSALVGRIVSHASGHQAESEDKEGAYNMCD